jgi:hypothetical protein
MFPVRVVTLTYVSLRWSEEKYSGCRGSINISPLWCEATKNGSVALGIESTNDKFQMLNGKFSSS